MRVKLRESKTKIHPAAFLLGHGQVVCRTLSHCPARRFFSCETPSPYAISAPMKKARAALLFLIVLITPHLSGAKTLRVGVFSLKNFGDSKVKKPARLKFIADRIAELAVKGICV